MIVVRAAGGLASPYRGPRGRVYRVLLGRVDWLVEDWDRLVSRFVLHRHLLPPEALAWRAYRRDGEFPIALTFHRTGLPLPVR